MQQRLLRPKARIPVGHVPCFFHQPRKTFDSVKRGGRMGHVLGKEEEWEKEGFPLVAWEGG